MTSEDIKHQLIIIISDFQSDVRAWVEAARLASSMSTMAGFEFLTATPRPSPDAWETALPPPGWPRRSGRLVGDKDWPSDDGAERPVSQSTAKSTPRSGLLWRHVFRRPRDGSTVRRSTPVLPAGSSSLCPANCRARPAPPLSHQTSPVPICPIGFVTFSPTRLTVSVTTWTRAHVSHRPLPFLMVHCSLFEPVTDELIRELSVRLQAKP